MIVNILIQLKNQTYFKLPKIAKVIVNDTNYNPLKMTKGANFNFNSGNSENKNNNSMEIQINTQYSKKNFKSMGKKVNTNTI